MILGFADEGTEDIYNGKETKAARGKVPKDLWAVAQRKLSYLRNARELRDLGSPPGNRLEQLKGSRKGQWSIRVNERYRVVFCWRQGGADEVWIGDYHDAR